MVHKKREDITEEFNRGTNLYLRGKKDEAILHFRKLIKKYPELSEPHIALGVIYFNEKRIKEAIKEFNLALELDPKNPLIHNNLGNLYQFIGDRERAIDEYRRSTELDPNFSLGHVNLSLIYEKMGKIKEAFEELKKGMRNPYGLPDEGLFLFFKLSIYYLIFNKFKKSEELIDRIVKKVRFKTGKEFVELKRKCRIIKDTIKKIKEIKGKEKRERIREILKEFEFKNLLKFKGIDDII